LGKEGGGRGKGNGRGKEGKGRGKGGEGVRVAPQMAGLDPPIVTAVGHMPLELAKYANLAISICIYLQ